MKLEKLKLQIIRLEQLDISNCKKLFPQGLFVIENSIMKIVLKINN